MKYSEKVRAKLYQNLGKLFYAIAIADRSVHIKEIDKLRKFIRTYWLEVDTVEDEYGEDAAFQIESVFDWLLEYEKDGDKCYEAFEDYYKDHQTEFTPYLKVLILDTANAIASSFSGKNKSELLLVGKLRLLFQGGAAL